MSKRTIILLNEKCGWVAGGQDGSTPELQQWQSVEWDSEPTVQGQARAVVEALSQAKLSRRNVILILGPSMLEYRPFQVPPVDARELPAIAQIQARTQLTQANDQSVVDFVTMPTSSSQGAAQAFIGATTQKTNLLLDELREQGLQFQRILPRTTALGLLHNDRSDRQFWINVQPNEMDVFVAGLEQLVLVRSSILPASGPVREKSIKREVNRTLVVLAAEFGSTSHRRVEIAGTAEDREWVKSEFEQPEQCHDLTPESIGQVTAQVPESEVGLAVVALATLAEKHPALLDFANPTQPPRDSEQMRRWVTIGALVATLLLAVAGFGWLNLRQLDSQIAELQQEIDMLDSSSDFHEKVIRDVGMINTYVQDDVGGLEVLQTLSEVLPYGDEMRLKKLEAGKEYQKDLLAVKLDSLVAGRADQYRSQLDQLNGWKIDPSPTRNTEAAKDSKFYEEGMSDIATFAPDFAQRFERYENVYFASLESEGEQDSKQVEAEDSETQPPVRGQEDEESEATDGEDSGSETETKESDDGRITTSVPGTEIKP